MKQKLNYSLYGNGGQRKYLTVGERIILMNTINKTEETDKRLFLLMLYYTGVRITEALKIEKRHVDKKDNCVVVESLKKRKRHIYRAIPLPKYYIDELLQYLKLINNQVVWSYSRSTAWRIVKSAMLSSEIDGIQACAKGLRHSFAVCAIENNVPLNLIAKWMGHSSISTTAIYLNVIGKEERAFAKTMWKS